MHSYQGIYIDSSIFSEIEKYYKKGFIRGVTTNPSIMVKDGLDKGLENIKKTSIKIANLVNPYPVSIEVLSEDHGLAKEQATEFSSWAPNIVIKLTIHGPNGKPDNLSLIKELSEKDISINATAMMSIQQCFLAAAAGASYVSLFCGRVNNMGYDSRLELGKLRNLIDKFSYKSKIIACSLREASNVMDWLASGAHIVTVPPSFIDMLIVHPYSKETIQMFLEDASKLI